MEKHTLSWKFFTFRLMCFSSESEEEYWSSEANEFTYFSTEPERDEEINQNERNSQECSKMNGKKGRSICDF